MTKGHGRTGRPWLRIRLAVLERDQYVCQIRGKRCRGYATTVDHIIPLHAAPSLAHDMGNLRAACLSCNSSTGATYGNKLRGSRKPPPPPRPRRLLW